MVFAAKTSFSLRFLLSQAPKSVSLRLKPPSAAVTLPACISPP